MKNSMEEKWIVCRVCLKQPNPSEVMVNIFDTDESKDMTKMILECGGVPIKQFDHYPDKICDKCLKYLRVAYKFRSTCQRSHQHLSRFIAPVVVEADPEDICLDFEEEINIKMDPDMKQEQEFTSEEVVDIYEPMEEIVDEEPLMNDEFEYEEIERSASAMSGEVEYLVELNELLSDDDDIEEIEPKPNKKIDKQSTVFVKKPLQAKPSTSRSNSNIVMTNKQAQLALRKDSIKKNPRVRQPKHSSYICDVCGNIYPSQGRLTEHIKLHNGIKPHECEICGHRFSQTQQLARHMNTHTGNRPYKCTYCTAAFADLSTRNKHHRIHTNERPYVCDVCGKAFTYTNTLKFHKMIHTGEKPHVCDICGKGFQQAYKLRNHKFTHEKKGISSNNSATIIKMEKVEVETIQTYHEVNAATAQILEI